MEEYDITPSWVAVIQMYKLEVDSNVSNITDCINGLKENDSWDPLVAKESYFDEINKSLEAINKTMNEFSGEMSRIGKVVDELNNENKEQENKSDVIIDKASLKDNKSEER